MSEYKLFEHLSYLDEFVKSIQVETLAVADSRPDLIEMFKLDGDSFD